MMVAMMCSCSSAPHNIPVFRARFTETFTAVVVRLCPIEVRHAPAARILDYNPRYIIVLREGIDKPNIEDLDKGLHIFAVHDPSRLFGSRWRYVVGAAFEFELRSGDSKLPSLVAIKEVATTFDWRDFLKGEEKFY